MNSFKIALIFMVVMGIVAITYTHIDIPTPWHLGKYVKSNTHFGGKYYQVNDTLRIIAIYGEGTYDKYRVYELNSGEWVNSGAETYSSVHLNMYDRIDYLRWYYNKKLRENTY